MHHRRVSSLFARDAHTLDVYLAGHDHNRDSAKQRAIIFQADGEGVRRRDLMGISVPNKTLELI
jgi:hypothetical protein